MQLIGSQDSEAYKGSVKKQIKDWHTTVAQRKHQEWLILNVVGPEVRPNPSGLLKMRGTVLDRIKADFNVDKKDRCVAALFKYNKLLTMMLKMCSINVVNRLQ